MGIGADIASILGSWGATPAQAAPAAAPAAQPDAQQAPQAQQPQQQQQPAQQQSSLSDEFSQTPFGRLLGVQAAAGTKEAAQAAQQQQDAQAAQQAAAAQKSANEEKAQAADKRAAALQPQVDKQFADAQKQGLLSTAWQILTQPDALANSPAMQQVEAQRQAQEYRSPVQASVDTGIQNAANAIPGLVKMGIAGVNSAKNSLTNTDNGLITMPESRDTVPADIQAQHPIAATAGQIAGSMPLVSLSGGTFPTSLPSAAAVGRGMLYGGGAGAATTPLSAEVNREEQGDYSKGTINPVTAYQQGDFADAVKQGGIGALIGGVLGATSPKPKVENSAAYKPADFTAPATDPNFPGRPGPSAPAEQVQAARGIQGQLDATGQPSDAQRATWQKKADEIAGNRTQQTHDMMQQWAADDPVKQQVAQDVIANEGIGGVTFGKTLPDKMAKTAQQNLKQSQQNFNAATQSYQRYAKSANPDPDMLQTLAEQRDAAAQKYTQSQKIYNDPAYQQAFQDLYQKGQDFVQNGQEGYYNPEKTYSEASGGTLGQQTGDVPYKLATNPADSDFPYQRARHTINAGISDAVLGDNPTSVSAAGQPTPSAATTRLLSGVQRGDLSLNDAFDNLRGWQQALNMGEHPNAVLNAMDGGNRTAGPLRPSEMAKARAQAEGMIRDTAAQLQGGGAARGTLSPEGGWDLDKRLSEGTGGDATSITDPKTGKTITNPRTAQEMNLQGQTKMNNLGRFVNSEGRVSGPDLTRTIFDPKYDIGARNAAAQYMRDVDSGAARQQGYAAPQGLPGELKSAIDNAASRGPGVLSSALQTIGKGGDAARALGANIGGLLGWSHGPWGAALGSAIGGTAGVPLKAIGKIGEVLGARKLANMSDAERAQRIWEAQKKAGADMSRTTAPMTARPKAPEAAKATTAGAAAGAVTRTANKAAQQAAAEQAKKMAAQNNNGTPPAAPADQGWAGVAPVPRAQYDQPQNKADTIGAKIINALMGGIGAYAAAKTGASNWTPNLGAQADAMAKRWNIPREQALAMASIPQQENDFTKQMALYGNSMSPAQYQQVQKANEGITNLDQAAQMVTRVNKYAQALQGRFSSGIGRLNYEQSKYHPGSPGGGEIEIDGQKMPAYVAQRQLEQQFEMIPQAMANAYLSIGDPTDAARMMAKNSHPTAFDSPQVIQDWYERTLQDIEQKKQLWRSQAMAASRLNAGGYGGGGGLLQSSGGLL